MMQRIKFRQILKLNLFFWGFWVILYAILLEYQWQLEKYIFGLYNAIIIYFPVFLLSLLLWPVCRKIDFRKVPTGIFFLIHILIANIFILLWLFFYFGTMYLIFANLLRSITDLPRAVAWQYPQGLLKYIMITGVYYTLIFYREVKYKELQESRLKLSIREAEWSALKAQVNPHFLFNSLNSISALIHQDANRARKMLINLSDLLRHSLSENPAQTVPLEKELHFLQKYLELEKIRFQDRLNYEEDVDPAARACAVPSMFLQPLIENAIKHGIAPSSKRGWIHLKIHRKEYHLIGRIVNSLPTGYLKKNKLSESKGTGLKNLQHRLQLIYENRSEFSAGVQQEDNTFAVKFRIPTNTEHSA